MAFTFVDLFAGIGGFHAALDSLGGECVLASEIDEAAVRVYQRNWGTGRGRPNIMHGDITQLAPDEGAVVVPAHDVLVAGFPCQPFSKSGAQEGVRDTTRGTLFFNILRIIEERKPSIVLLENVRNLAGPRHRQTWATIIRTLREAGYRVSATPTVFSPHLLPPEFGGTPQVRERVFIAGVYVGIERAMQEIDVVPVLPKAPLSSWDPSEWSIADTPLRVTNGRPLLLSDDEIPNVGDYRLSLNETRWIDAWDDFVQRMWEARQGVRLPGFPLWADDWVHIESLRIPAGTPKWKADFLRKNSKFYTDHRSTIDGWLEDWDHLKDFPPSRRKLEWQAQDASRLWDCVMHFRPSGIRAKRPTYLPALVAITQTSIIGPRKRRLTPREAARLQGLPDWFDFGGQRDSLTYRQLGNGVSVDVVFRVLSEFIHQNRFDLPKHIVESVIENGRCVPLEAAPVLADENLDSWLGVGEMTGSRV